MFTLRARNVNEALYKAILALDEHGISEDSRNGPVLVMPEPVTTVYLRPQERVMTMPERDHNPFFALFETLWMFAGRNDLDYLTKFNKNMALYSDDGTSVRGSAYGYRWRQWFGHDQLLECCEHLENNPESRRVVMSMWDAASDPLVESKDIPCNLQVLFRMRTVGQRHATNGNVPIYDLDMTVYNRSNDVIYGAYGSNAVHFSMLQEYVAAYLNNSRKLKGHVLVGKYFQVANNLHAYTDNLAYQRVQRVFQQRKTPVCQYEAAAQRDLYTVRLVQVDEQADQFLEECGWFVDHGDDYVYSNTFISDVAVPMLKAFNVWRDRDSQLNHYARWKKAMYECESIEAEDWEKAASEWLSRRYAAAAALKQKDENNVSE